MEPKSFLNIYQSRMRTPVQKLKFFRRAGRSRCVTIWPQPPLAFGTQAGIKQSFLSCCFSRTQEIIPKLIGPILGLLRIQPQMEE